MDNFTAMMLVEEPGEDVTEEEYYAAWQHLVDTGLAWQLQGWFGRTAMGMIEQGLLEPPS